MNQSSLVNPVHNVSSHLSFKGQGCSFLSLSLPWASPCHLLLSSTLGLWDKHGHSLRTSKSSAIWQLQDHGEPGERMLERMMPGEGFLSQELLAASCPAQLARLEHL